MSTAMKLTCETTHLAVKAAVHSSRQVPHGADGNGDNRESRDRLEPGHCGSRFLSSDLAWLSADCWFSATAEIANTDVPVGKADLVGLLPRNHFFFAAQSSKSIGTKPTQMISQRALLPHRNAGRRSMTFSCEATPLKTASLQLAGIPESTLTPRL
jgi:hypothetical protein